MRKKGFTLIEVLIAVMVIGITFVALLYLHINSEKNYEEAKRLFYGTITFSNYFNGKYEKGIKVKHELIHINLIPVIQETYEIPKLKLKFKVWRIGTSNE